MQSTNDPRLLIGLGSVAEVLRLTVRWPSGAISIREHLATEQTYEIVEPRPEDAEKLGLAEEFLSGLRSQRINNQ